MASLKHYGTIALVAVIAVIVAKKIPYVKNYL